MAKNIKPVTAADVRNFFNADPKRLAALSPEARKTVEAVDGKNPKGRLHREAVALHNKRRKSAQYVTGNSKALGETAKANADALREQAREAGFKVGKRGPLPKEFIASLKG